ncbi:MAG: hypothetical protein KC619_31755, partial [Myxococcales bacterium]|nr:hypothetical protein [Myxococcales bacterium]
RVGVLTPEEGRALAEDVFNTEFRKLPDDWVKKPITLTLAGIQNSGAEMGFGDEGRPVGVGVRSDGGERARGDR